jgi:hypothetical protein
MAKGIKPKNSDEIILVDDEDYEWLNQYSWHISKTGYVYTSVWLRCKKKDRKFRMHRMILNRHGFDISSKETDHININKLDNRKENLRVCTRSENLRNKKKNPNRSMSSKYKGIQKTRFGTFSVLVGITVNGKGKIKSRTFL